MTGSLRPPGMVMEFSKPKSVPTASSLLPGVTVGPPTVMVVDDDPTFCAIMGEILKMYNARVYSANSAEEAIGLLQTITPDLILTDVMMPEVDGLTFVRRIRSEEPYARVPVIVVSAGVSSREQAAALQAGADSFLAKPFSLKDLREAVGTLLPDNP